MNFLRKSPLSFAIIFLLVGNLAGCTAMQEWYENIMSVNEEQNEN